MPIVLITGGAGSIGSKLSGHFSRLGWPLRRIDRDSHGKDDVLVADLADWRDDWVEQFAGVDTVVHLAANGSPEASFASVERYNIDLTFNVFEAAVRHRVRRIIFASSNWVVAGKRFEEEPLDPRDEVAPVNAYGTSKWVGERIGKSYAEKHDISVICFRIGYCQGKRENLPGPHMQWGLWGQQMWLSDRDLCQAFEKAVTAPDAVRFEVLNLMSDCKGMRWEIESARRAIGYVPMDSYEPQPTREIEKQTTELEADWRTIELLRAKEKANRW